MSANSQLIDLLITERARVRFLLSEIGMDISDLDRAALLCFESEARQDIEALLDGMRIPCGKRK
jgi:hypothetical protein